MVTSRSLALGVIAALAGQAAADTVSYKFTEADITAMTAIYNKYRSLHGVPEATWNTTIADFESNWALNRATAGEMTHSSGRSWGENAYSWWGSGMGTVAQLSSQPLNGSAPMEDWYNEIASYDWTAPAPGNSGHFTAMVWKSSTQFGCGAAYTGSGNSASMYFYCGYGSPTGEFNNLIGSFYDNVLPPQSGNYSQYLPLYKTCGSSKDVDSDATFAACAKDQSKAAATTTSTTSTTTTSEQTTTTTAPTQTSTTAAAADASTTAHHPSGSHGSHSIPPIVNRHPSVSRNSTSGPTPHHPPGSHGSHSTLPSIVNRHPSVSRNSTAGPTSDPSFSHGRRHRKHRKYSKKYQTTNGAVSGRGNQSGQNN